MKRRYHAIYYTVTADGDLVIFGEEREGDELRMLEFYSRSEGRAALRARRGLEGPLVYTGLAAQVEEIKAWARRVYGRAAQKIAQLHGAIPDGFLEQGPGCYVTAGGRVLVQEYENGVWVRTPGKHTGRGPYQDAIRYEPTLSRAIGYAAQFNT